MTPRELEFLRIVEADPDIAATLTAMSTFGAADLWLVSGVLFQTVWNILDGYPRGHGIKDYDLFYFDEDTSEETEDRWIKRAAVHFAFAPCEVQLRNQARVHLWYREKFAMPEYPRLHSSCDGVCQFLLPACMVAIRPTARGTELFAPLGVDDIFDRILRPNPLWQGRPRPEYLAKVTRYMRDWPSLREIAGEPHA